MVVSQPPKSRGAAARWMRYVQNFPRRTPFFWATVFSIETLIPREWNKVFRRGGWSPNMPPHGRQYHSLLP